MSACKICGSRQSIFFHRIDTFNYFFCRNCTTLYLYPAPSLQFLKSFYSHTFDYSAGKINELNIRIHSKQILKRLRIYYPKGRTLLDVGSGYGYFLDEACMHGLVPTGIEPSPLSSTYPDYLKKSIKHASFDSYHNQFPNQKFDFVTMIHTIEHLAKPQPVVKKAASHLNRNGVLYIETPNLDSHLFYSEKYNYTFLTPPEHVWIFSRFSFQKILSLQKNCEIINCSSYSQPEHCMGILKRSLKSPLNLEMARNTTKLHKVQINKAKFSLKYILLDTVLAPLLTPLLNSGVHGSILELYIRKK